MKIPKASDVRKVSTLGFRAMFLGLVVVFLASCGGGGGGASTPATISDPPPPPSPIDGYFVDDPVAGLSYKAGSITGSTDATGKFSCYMGTTIEFSIGQMTLGSAPCGALVTPVDLVENGTTRNPVVMAIASLLQTLDADGSGDNGVITLTQDVEDWVNQAMADRGSTSLQLSSLLGEDIVAFAKDIMGKSRGDTSVDNDLIYVTPIEATDRMESNLAAAGQFSPYVQEAFLGEQADQIGGSTTATAQFVDGEGRTWTLFNIAHKLNVTPVQPGKGPIYQLTLPAFIQDIKIVDYNDARYALVAVAQAGISVVDVTNPAAPSLVRTVPVYHYKDGITFAEGGGSLVTGYVIETSQAPVDTMETDGTTLWIGDVGYGIHKTALSNLLGATPVTNADGTLKIDADVYTLQYSGERPWGGPKDLLLHGGYLYAAQGFLGIAIYNPDTLERVGYYNLYTDTSVTEDWFVDMNVANEVQSGNIDPNTGMPNADQASFEILQVWHGGVDAPTPWADYDRYGKYYYDARAIDVADFDNGQGGNHTRVFVAYGLAGLIALDADNPANIQYLGYAPAVPAHGPDKPTGSKSKSLFPYYGVGKLKEAGVVDVHVDAANNRVFYTDHFAGLVALDGANNPAANWRQAGAPFDNDTIGVLGDHWPDYEFVTSYDMGPYNPLDNESLPIWIYQAPSLLVSGEVSGHGSAFELKMPMDSGVGNIDVVLGNGSGGMDFVDLGDLSQTNMADRFSVALHFATTDEIGAAVDGSATYAISLGHTQGVKASDNYLYVADGPHGMIAFRINDDSGVPIDQPHVVANTLGDEYPEDVNGTTVYPTPHAYGIEFGPEGGNAYVLSQSLGLRRVDITGVEAGDGSVGSPLLLTPQPSDFYEHSTHDTEGSGSGIHRQDHAYAVEFYDHYAVVADGSNGLTVYDLSVDPTLGSTHVVANFGAASGQPGLGRATGVKLWTDRSNKRLYAFVAAGPSGIGVVDMTGLFITGQSPAIELVKLFEPIKTEVEEDGSIHLGKADSRAVDVDVVGDNVYVAYSGYGILAYTIADLLAPLPEGIPPNEIWSMHDYDYRPVALANFRLQDLEGFEESDAEALYMVMQYFPANVTLHNDAGDFRLEHDKLLMYASFGAAGVAKIDWTDPANPVLLEHQDTIGEATDVAIAHGRVYVADYAAGMVIFRPVQGE